MHRDIQTAPMETNKHINRLGFSAKFSTQVLGILGVLVCANLCKVAEVSAQDAAPADDSEMNFSLEEAEGTAEPTAEAEAAPASADPIADLASEGETQADTAVRDAPTRGEAAEEIYAVQQIFALRINRVELIPTVSFTLNDPYISHTGIGLGLNYWWTNVLALGANFIWYEGLESESDLGFQVRRSTRLAVPVNNYQFAAHLNFTYVPLYGKFSMFNEFIFQWDAYVLGGIGMMRTKPVPVIDPEVRKFEFDLRVAFNLGIGLRVFVTRWLAIVAEVRDYMYLEQLENLRVALGDKRQDPSTWTQGSPSFINNVTAHLGFAVFLPFDFEYKKPR